ncbi:DUF350 domain-containing protein [Lysinibacillus xylanilyticus]|uniref:DUF350 domain-containing protein n=1 Tax=Lysinibacillus xylanilyticus TaxID=582475 RepID=A0ABT4EVC7_9BACI|nr:DUF350 domain-containing protein [Lysinibacillus xylanilyticus]MCY9549628.1 DUF350 domain-containing protein [Lysinibacillus xylanilyticus]
MGYFSLDSFLNFLLYTGTGFILIFIGIVAFTITTKFSEWNLIKKSNKAVAIKARGKSDWIRHHSIYSMVFKCSYT